MRDTMSQMQGLDHLEQARGRERFIFHGAQCDISAVIRSDILLVTFDNLASVNERPVDGPWKPWLADRARLLGYSIAGFQTHQKDWYRTAEPAQQIAQLVQTGFFDPFRRILFVGASMGGFAALCFAGLVLGARVLAFSPQSSLNQTIAPFEQRYPWPYRKFDWHTADYLDAAAYVDKIAGGHIFFDPHQREDALHAKRLRTPALEQVAVPFGGHNLIRTVAKCGALNELIRQLAETDELEPEFWRQMRHRRAVPTWAKSCLRGAIDRAEGVLARQACDFLIEQFDYGFARRMRKAMVPR